MPSRVQTGFNVIALVAVGAIGLSVVALLIAINNGQKVDVAVVRLVFGILLGVNLMRGRAWARLLAALLYGAAGVVALKFAMQVPAPFIIIMAVFYLGGALAVGFLPQVTEYFQYINAVHAKPVDDEASME